MLKWIFFASVLIIVIQSATMALNHPEKPDFGKGTHQDPWLQQLLELPTDLKLPNPFKQETKSLMANILPDGQNQPLHPNVSIRFKRCADCKEAMKKYGAKKC